MLQDVSDREKAGAADIVVASTMAIVCLLALWLVYLTPRPSEPVAIVSSPWQQRTAAEIAARAGGYLIESAYSGGLIIAQSDDPDFAQRLAAEGALIIFNPRVFAGCGATKS